MLQLSRKTKLFLVLVLIVATLSNGFYLLSANAATLDDVKDVLSDSNQAVAANHSIHFTTTEDIGDNGYFEVELPADFGAIATGTCSGPNVVVSTSTLRILRCTYTLTPGAATTTVINILNTTNPLTSGPQIIEIKTYNSGDTELDKGQASVYVLDNTYFEAQVSGSLEFSMGDSLDVTYVNGIKVTGSSTPNTLNFGKIEGGSSTTLAHKLTITSNAQYGYSCTVQQNQDLTEYGGYTINNFNNSPDGVGSTTPETWKPPLGVVDQTNTYGHWAITSDDDSLSSLDFTGSKYVGLNGTNNVEVMYHDDIADGETLGIGVAYVAYTIEITSMQEHGHYENNLMYICTGNY